MAGLNPQNAAEVNQDIGTVLRQFVSIKEAVARRQTFLAATDLKIAPYSMTAGDETNIKSAVSGLNTALQAFDMTFVNRLTGLF